MKKELLWFVVGTLFCSYGFGQAPELPKMPKIKFTWANKYQPILDFEDGRQAQVLTQELPIETVSMNMELAESSCPVKLKSPRCRFEIPIKSQVFGLVWTKHPTDKSKLGKMVTYKSAYHENGQITFSEARDVLNSEDFQTESHIYSTPTVPEARKIKLICEDPNLIPSLFKSTEQFEILTWSAETNTENPETRVSENRSFQAAENIKFKKKNNTYVMESIGHHMGEQTVFAGQNLQWVFKGAKGEICEASFSTDLSALQTYVFGLLALDPDISKATPIQWSGNGFFLENIKTFIEDNLSITYGVVE